MCVKTVCARVAGYESTVQELAVSETEMEYSTSVGQNAGDYNIISVPDLHCEHAVCCL